MPTGTTLTSFWTWLYRRGKLITEASHDRCTRYVGPAWLPTSIDSVEQGGFLYFTFDYSFAHSQSNYSYVYYILYEAADITQFLAINI